MNSSSSINRTGPACWVAGLGVIDYGRAGRDIVLTRRARGHPASAGFTRSDLLTRLYAVDLTDVRKEMMLDGVRAFLACATAASWAAPQAMHVPSRGWAGGAAALTMR